MPWMSDALNFEGRERGGVWKAARNGGGRGVIAELLCPLPYCREDENT